MCYRNFLLLRTYLTFFVPYLVVLRQRVRLGKCRTNMEFPTLCSDTCHSVFGGSVENFIYSGKYPTYSYQFSAECCYYRGLYYANSLITISDPGYTGYKYPNQYGQILGRWVLWWMLLGRGPDNQIALQLEHWVKNYSSDGSPLKQGWV